MGTPTWKPWWEREEAEDVIVLPVRFREKPERKIKSQDKVKNKKPVKPILVIKTCEECGEMLVIRENGTRECACANPAKESQGRRQVRK